MKERSCNDCGKDISKRPKRARRCIECSNRHHLTLMKKYRDTHKNEIREYQRVYYGRK